MPLFSSRPGRVRLPVFRTSTARQAGLIGVVLVLTLCFGCRKPAGTGWDVDVVVPLLNSRLNINNFVGDTLLGSDSTGLLHLRYDRRVASLKLDSLVELPDEQVIDTLQAPFDATLQPGQQITNFPPTEVKFDVANGIEIAYADIRQGMLIVDFSNDVSEALDLIYRVPSATRNGMPLEIRETVPPGNHSLKKTYDLAGYRLNMRGEHGNKYNTIVQTYTVGLNPNASSVAVQGGQGAIIAVSFGNIVPQYIEGYFGQETYDIENDTVSFGLAKGIEVDNFALSEANMKFSIVNEIGADFVASFSGIQSINTKKNSTIPLLTNQLSRIPINWPVEKMWDGVRGSTTTLVFNNTNSNITSFISNLPDRISYAGKVSINPKPQGDAVGHTNYAFYNTGVHIDVDVDIPLRYSADKFRLETVASTDFSDIKQLDYVRGGNFVISVTNGYPFAAVLQVYMQDGRGAVIDSLMLAGANVMQRGQLDANNKVVQPASSDLLMPASQQKASNLKKTKSLRIKTTFLMPPTPPDIPVYNDYEFEVKVRAELLYNVGIRAD